MNDKLALEQLVIAFQEINNDKNKSSGYLGNISDRSKTLYIEKQTVGQYLWNLIQKNKHTSLKNKVFYRQDYLDEFEQIWETQARFHEILSPTLKEEIRDTVIFYQRKLKSQKGLLGYCEFESWQMVQKDKQGNVILNKLSGLPKMSTVGHKVIPKSSPLFQEFKIWQNLNNLELISRTIENERYVLNQDQKELLFEELNFKGPISEKSTQTYRLF